MKEHTGFISAWSPNKTPFHPNFHELFEVPLFTHFAQCLQIPLKHTADHRLSSQLFFFSLHYVTCWQPQRVKLGSHTAREHVVLQLSASLQHFPLGISDSVAGIGISMIFCPKHMDNSHLKDFFQHLGQVVQMETWPPSSQVCPWTSHTPGVQVNA